MDGLFRDRKRYKYASHMKERIMNGEFACSMANFFQFNQRGTAITVEVVDR